MYAFKQLPNLHSLMPSDVPDQWVIHQMEQQQL
jgi:hypothetical protein